MTSDSRKPVKRRTMQAYKVKDGPMTKPAKSYRTPQRGDAFAGRIQQTEVGVTNLTNAGLVLYIEHVPTEYIVEFPAFLDGFSDAYNSEWIGEQVYGRMDPIATYAHTRRALSLAWIVPAASEDEARANMAKINGIVSFLYPLYDSQGGKNEGAIMNMGPLWRVKFGSLVQDAATGGPLLGYVNGITVDPMLEAGMFTTPGTGGMEYLPKTIRLNVELTVLHEHSMGWTKQGEVYVFRGGKQGFPYASKENLAAAPVGAGQITNSQARNRKNFDPNSPAYGNMSRIIQGNDE